MCPLSWDLRGQRSQVPMNFCLLLMCTNTMTCQISTALILIKKSKSTKYKEKSTHITTGKLVCNRSRKEKLKYTNLLHPLSYFSHFLKMCKCSLIACAHCGNTASIIKWEITSHLNCQKYFFYFTVNSQTLN